MPSFKPTKLWEAPPHTLAKLEIVGRYLYLWFTIVGSNPKNHRLVYIDGFAGPGRYTNTETSSPLVALQAAKDALEIFPEKLRKTEFCFLFVEKKPEFANSLKEAISAISWPSQFKWAVENCSFEEKVGGMLEDFQHEGKQLAPTFAFIDPFGATGLPFKVIAKILQHSTCEVLLNLDSDGIGRLVTAQTAEKNQAHLDVLFGNSSWRTELNPHLPMPQLSAQILALYKKRLRSTAPYVYAFAMNSREGQLNYHLVFASQYYLGLEKMKEAMKAVDQTGTCSFSDDTVGQELLVFDFNAPAVWAEKMQQTLGGIWRPYSDFRDFALNETPFTNPKAMLRHLDDKRLVEIEAEANRRKGSFPEEKIGRIIIQKTLL
ncbi:MAG: three-Cys-motif partner protein TcmP [Verrucomicrobiota bacterium]|jgi:three-Cys-motif partner protein